MGALIELPPPVKCFGEVCQGPCSSGVCKRVTVCSPRRGRNREFRLNPFEDASHRGGRPCGQTRISECVCDIFLNRKRGASQIEDVRNVGLEFLYGFSKPNGM